MENGNFVKNNINVDFNINDLNMTPYIHKSANLNMQPHYQLYAMTVCYSNFKGSFIIVQNHEGTLTSGHYTSIIHNHKTNQWLKFDDDRVTEINQNSIQVNLCLLILMRNLFPEPQVIYFVLQKCLHVTLCLMNEELLHNRRVSSVVTLCKHLSIFSNSLRDAYGDLLCHFCTYIFCHLL